MITPYCEFTERKEFAAWCEKHAYMRGYGKARQKMRKVLDWWEYNPRRAAYEAREIVNIAERGTAARPLFSTVSISFNGRLPGPMPAFGAGAVPSKKHPWLWMINVGRDCEVFSSMGAATEMYNHFMRRWVSRMERDPDIESNSVYQPVFLSIQNRLKEHNEGEQNESCEK